MGIDTLSFVKKLRAVGVDERQAEAVNEVFADFQDKRLTDLATKSDLAALASAAKSDLANVETSLKAEIKLLKWMNGFILALVAGIFMMLLKSGIVL